MNITVNDKTIITLRIITAVLSILPTIAFYIEYNKGILGQDLEAIGLYALIGSFSFFVFFLPSIILLFVWLLNVQYARWLTIILNVPIVLYLAIIWHGYFVIWSWIVILSPIELVLIILTISKGKKVIV